MALATSESEHGFHSTGFADLDARRRLSLGRVGRAEHTRYEIRQNDLGEILLIPQVSIPARELIVWENTQIRNSLERGIEQASYGKVEDRGDFTQYLDEVDE